MTASSNAPGRAGRKYCSQKGTGSRGRRRHAKRTVCAIVPKEPITSSQGATTMIPSRKRGSTASHRFWCVITRRYGPSSRSPCGSGSAGINPALPPMPPQRRRRWTPRRVTSVHQQPWPCDAGTPVLPLDQPSSRSRRNQHQPCYLRAEPDGLKSGRFLPDPTASCVTARLGGQSAPPFRPSALHHAAAAPADASTT